MTVWNSKQVSEYGTREWANDQLRYAIKVLKGQAFRSSWEGRLSYALLIKDQLADMGFVWQAVRIENWIHRLQPRKGEADSLRGEQREASSDVVIHTDLGDYCL